MPSTQRKVKKVKKRKIYWGLKTPLTAVGFQKVARFDSYLGRGAEELELEIQGYVPQTFLSFVSAFFFVQSRFYNLSLSHVLHSQYFKVSDEYIPDMLELQLLDSLFR